MRSILKTISFLSNHVFKVPKTQIRNLANALTKEQVTVLNPETLTGRILQYLNIDNDSCQHSFAPTSDILSNLRQNKTYLLKLTTPELIDFTNNLPKENINRKELSLVLKEIDTEATLRLSEFCNKSILRLLNTYMCLVPNRITELKFFQHAMKILSVSLHKLSKKELLQVIFYIGLQKKNINSQTMLRKCMQIMDTNFINNLSIEELCIICNATFKTSTKIINKSLLRKVRECVNDNLSVLKDCALFVTLVKTVRHNRFQDDNLLSTISCATFFNKTYTSYSFPMICHIMALYADYFYYDESLLKMFTKQCLQQLNESIFLTKKAYLTEQLRGKDIKRFLWIMGMFSYMKLVTQSEIREVIVPKLLERIEAGEFEGDVTSLIDITLYLWILNYRPYELVPYIFNKRNSKLLFSYSNKNYIRLNALLFAISIEDPDLFNRLNGRPESIPNNIYSDDYQIRKRPLLEKLLNSLNGITQDLNLTKFKLTRGIPQLNIVGITGYRNGGNKVVYVELLDDYTRLRNTETDVPVGLMALNLRLLDHFEEGVLTVCQRDIEDMTDAELNEYLLTEIKLIC